MKDLIPGELEFRRGAELLGAPVQRIELPMNEYMLRAGDHMFSSLTPGRAPTIVPAPVVNNHQGGDFYDHGDYLISTVSIANGNPELASDNLALGMSNYHGMWTIPPESSRKYHAELAAEADWPDKPIGEEGQDYGNLSPYVIEDLFRGQTIRGTRNVIDIYPGHISFNARDARTPTHFGTGVRIDNLEDLAYKNEQMLWSRAAAGKGALQLPGATPVSEILRPQGVGLVHWEYGDDPRFGFDHLGEPRSRGMEGVNAYLDGKQIVSHPIQLMPDEQAYAYINIIGEHEGDYTDLDWTGKMQPTRILTHIYPVEKK